MRKGAKMFAGNMGSSRDMFQQDGLGMTMPMRTRAFVQAADVCEASSRTSGLKAYVRNLMLVEGGNTMKEKQSRNQRIDAMIRRRACLRMGKQVDGEANHLVICALKALPMPDCTLPPKNPGACANPTLQAWLPSMEFRTEVALRKLCMVYQERRETCLGAAEAIDRLRAVDAVRRSLIVAVGRGDEDVAMRAMSLLNELGACDARGRGLCAEDMSTLEDLDDALDTKVRPLEYWLAVHHFERCWLNDQRKAVLENGRGARVA